MIVLTACPADPDDAESDAGATAPSSSSTPATETTDQSSADAPACTDVAMSLDADESQWNAIHDELEAACSPRGACTVCNSSVCRLQLYECGETTSSGSGDELVA